MQRRKMLGFADFGALNDTWTQKEKEAASKEVGGKADLIRITPI